MPWAKDSALGAAVARGGAIVGLNGAGGGGVGDSGRGGGGGVGGVGGIGLGNIGVGGIVGRGVDGGFSGGSGDSYECVSQPHSYLWVREARAIFCTRCGDIKQIGDDGIDGDGRYNSG